MGSAVEHLKIDIPEDISEDQGAAPGIGPVGWWWFAPNGFWGEQWIVSWCLGPILHGAVSRAPALLNFFRKLLFLKKKKKKI